MAAHTVIAGMQKVPEDVVKALRDDTPINDPKLEALRVFATEVAGKRGYPSEESLRHFLSSGTQRRKSSKSCWVSALKPYPITPAILRTRNLTAVLICGVEQ